MQPGWQAAEVVTSGKRLIFTSHHSTVQVSKITSATSACLLLACVPDETAVGPNLSCNTCHALQCEDKAESVDLASVGSNALSAIQTLLNSHCGEGSNSTVSDFIGF